MAARSEKPEATAQNATECRVGLAHSERGREGPSHAAYEPGHLASLIERAVAHGTEEGRGLSSIIPQGGSVLLKPNWVAHENEGSGGKECLVTHPEFVIAALTEVLKARPARVIIGDAPIQRCDFQALLPPGFEERVDALARQHGAVVEVIDFRRTVFESGGLSANVKKDIRSESRYVRFDVGSDSMLEPISSVEPRFRVADYDPDRLVETHRPGRHCYLLCRDAFEVDCILSLPKLKTHCKAGITGTVKNLVGLNGDKDFLPHHRFGGSERGGDCYPGKSRTREFAEGLDDAANRRIGQRGYGLWRQASRVARYLSGGGGGRMSGAWHGNDTVWRMVLDLNRIVRFGRLDGSLSDSQQRKVLSLTDAIVCGQGEGPLRPDPIDMGVVTFSDAPFAAERLHARLLGLDPDRIPLLAHAGDEPRWPLPDAAAPVRIRSDAGELSMAEAVSAFGVRARPPAGWAGFIERRAA